MSAARRLRLMLLLLAAVLGGVAGLCWLANPYGTWKTTLIDRRYRSVTSAPSIRNLHERVTTPYRLRTERPTHLLVGSSRMLWGVPIEVGSAGGFMNASLLGATVPEIAAILRAAMASGELRQVVWGVDFFPFSTQFPATQDPEMQARLRGATGPALRDIPYLVKENLLNLDVLRESWLVLSRRVAGREIGPPPHPVPWSEPAIAAALAAPDPTFEDTPDAQVQRQISGNVGIHRNYELSHVVVAELREVIAQLRQAGVEVTLVVFPLSVCELEVIRRLGLWDEFREWKRTLLAAAGPYWDFSGYSAAAGRARLFIDSMHLRPAAGHVVLRTVLGAPCDECGDDAGILAQAGAWVDGATIDAHLAARDPSAVPGDSLDARCVRLVAEHSRAQGSGT